MDGSLPMRYIDETFENWGSTLLANVTVRTFFPRNVRGIQAVVRLAARKVKHKKTCSAVFNFAVTRECGFERRLPGTPSTRGCGAWRATCSPALW